MATGVNQKQPTAAEWKQQARRWHQSSLSEYKRAELAAAKLAKCERLIIAAPVVACGVGFFLGYFWCQIFGC